MKRYAPALIVLAAFFAGQLVSAAAPLLTFLPHVAGSAFQQQRPTLLDGGDNTFVSAVQAPGGCVFLSYIDRDNGNRLHVVQDMGSSLHEVPLPPLGSAALVAPSFEAPGDKQADGFLLLHDGVMSIYYTSRAPDDEGGSFKLWRLDIQTPNCL